MKLIKLNTDHYIIVDDSEIKEGDWIVSINGYWKGKIAQSTGEVMDCWKKITHSTEPFKILSDTANTWESIKNLSLLIRISLSEVKELLGEVDVEKKAEKWFLINQYNQQDMIHSHRIPEYITTKNLWVTAYNQALEDNKHKKYTEEDIREAILLYSAWITGGTPSLRIAETSEQRIVQIIKSLQPKTEWEVEFVDGKLKLK